MVRSTKPRVVLVGLMLAAATTVVSNIAAPPSATAMGKIRCDVDGAATVAVGRFDPIMHHDQRPTAEDHEHQFFGNKAWLRNLENPNDARWSDLAGESTNCRVGSDTAGYWTPTLRYKAGTPNAGQLVPAQQFTAYYRPYGGAGSPDFGPGIAYPRNTRLVSAPGHSAWTCGQYSGARAEPSPTIPDCSGLSGKPGLTLTAHIDFPSCWDGVLPHHRPSEVGDTSDSRHFAYPVQKECPAKYPIKTVQLRETIQYPYVGKGDDLVLASDNSMGVSDGESLHADFFNAWDQQGFERFVADCVNDEGAYSDAKCQP